MEIRSEFVIVCILLLNLRGIGQNLVPNPGYEEFVSCPNSENQLDSLCLAWKSPSDGSPDYFNRCYNANNYNDRSDAMNSFGIPDNFAGYMESQSNAYVGFIPISSDWFYREYLQVELKNPLRKDTLYQVIISLALAEYSSFSPSKLALCISENSPKIKSYKYSNDYYNGRQVEILKCDCSSTLIIDISSITTKNWTDFKTEFKASGNEQFLTIGLFKNDIKRKNHNEIVSDFRRDSKAYFYIDNVFVGLMEHTH